MRTTTPSKTTRKTHCEPCCVRVARQASARTSTRTCWQMSKRHRDSRRSRKITKGPEMPQNKITSGKSIWLRVLLALQNPRSQRPCWPESFQKTNVGPKHHSTNITPTSSRTAPQSYQKAPTSYICKPASTNIVPTKHQTPRKQQQ